MMSAREFTSMDFYRSYWTGQDGQVLDQEVPWMGEVRKEAITSLEEKGFPGRRDEAWAYTRAKSFLSHEFPPLLAPLQDTPPSLPAPLPGAAYCVFVDGRYCPELSTLDSSPKGYQVQSLGEALSSHPELAKHLGSPEEGFGALNLLFATGGLYIEVPEGVDGGLLEIVHIATEASHGKFTNLRHVLKLHQGAQLKVVEGFGSANTGPYWNQVCMHATLAPSSILHHVRVQDEGLEALHMGRMVVVQEEKSRFESCVFSLGAQRARTDIETHLVGSEAYCALNGLYLARGSQHVDHHTRIQHTGRNSVSRELYKGLLGGKSRGVFMGEVIVDADAMGTDSSQTNNNLLLSDTAIANTRPQLEIFADDVRCTHGATVGQLDPKQLFYGRSRGLSLADTKGLLTYAFANEVLEGTMKVSDELQGQLLERLIQWM